MPTCTQITDALKVLASSVDPKTIDDISNSSATLVGISPTEQVVQLSSGGNAFLSVPPTTDISNKAFKLIITGKAHSPSVINNGMHLKVYMSDSVYPGREVYPLQINTFGYDNQDHTFFLELDMVYDPEMQWVTTPDFPLFSSITSQDEIKFCISAYTQNALDSNASLTIKQFKITLL